MERIGRGWRGRCYFPFNGHELRFDQGFEYLVHAADYGSPTATSSQASFPLAVDRTVHIHGRSHFCRISLPKAGGFDFSFVIGEGKTLSLPGQFFPGNLCLSAAQGSAVAEIQNGNNLLTLE